ncbi:uncharacterized protein RHIMIDRAFT_240447 [Rhizopus microsporus ATCC 52813]|uniref:Uncharacterized protein n=1 Tax=Rhizopus microsporus ATCC 52813 TaxID=1340429 RepID=A0A2G4SLX6_RHIZD|nr:uncharacterized protein RHIMIDRAFT_240447 [Rhizopus microsporus ATCC 52813]PHZ09774.1 hypothetical protein RHIMIDRAFT_240447 [Rhizopus microsporus ATCC 52813]
MMEQCPYSNRVFTYTNPIRDDAYKWLDANPINAINAIHSVSGDGNRGFRAVSFDAYKTQDNWILMKEDMLATYMHEENYNTLYKAVGDSSTIDFERQAMIARLSSRISSCNNNRSL